MNLKVKDIMTRQVIRVDPNEPVAVAARMLSRYNVGVLPVCDDTGRIEGMITDRDIVLRCVAADKDPERTPVRHVMTGRVVTVGADVPLIAAAEKMAREQVRRLPVEDRGKLCGVITLGDIAANQETNVEAAEAFAEICANVSSR